MSTARFEKFCVSARHASVNDSRPVTPGGSDVDDGALAVDAKLARRMVTGASVTSYAVRKRQATPRTGWDFSSVPRGIRTGAVSCAATPPMSNCATEHDGNGRR
ncbi:hypothetical protein D3C71_1796570 [compost metagenome]